jgi:hypothetical protein
MMDFHRLGIDVRRQGTHGIRQRRKAVGWSFRSARAGGKQGGGGGEGAEFDEVATI